MATGYEKIFTLIQKKNQKVVSEVSSPLTCGNILEINETAVKPRGFQATGPEVSGEQPTSPSLSNEDKAKIIEIIELTLTGQLTESVMVPVLPGFQYILGRWVWFCPDLETTEAKIPKLAFTPEELMVIIPLLIEDRELASTLVSAKKIFGGTIMDSSLLDFPTAVPHDDQMGAEDFQAPEGNEPPNPVPPGELPGEGRHLVKIAKVFGYFHNSPDYVGSRARLMMKILEGADVGKTLIDNISLPHPEESKDMQLRRVRIAHRLGLIIWGTKETLHLNWKLLEGVICSVDVAYKSLGGRKVLTVDNYQIQ